MLYYNFDDNNPNEMTENYLSEKHHRIWKSFRMTIYGLKLTED